MWLYRSPAVRKFRYLWKMDSDSYLREDVTEDVFVTLQQYGGSFGYLEVARDGADTGIGLKEAVAQFATHLSSRPILRYGEPTFSSDGPGQNFSSWTGVHMYNGHSEVSDMRLFRSVHYRQYWSFLDGTGGFLRSRWGDHIVRTAYLSLFVPESKILCMRAFIPGFRHAGTPPYCLDDFLENAPRPAGSHDRLRYNNGQGCADVYCENEEPAERAYSY